MQLKHIFIDLDNTVYPASTGLAREIDRLMTGYVAGYFKIPAEQARELRTNYMREFGTTLNGLMENERFKEVEDYFRRVHPPNVSDFIRRDEELIKSLAQIKIPKSVLTNAPREHAQRILKAMQLESQFENLFDIRYAGFKGKPNRSYFLMALKDVACEPAEVLFIDDLKRYLWGFKRLGGYILQVKEDGRMNPHDINDEVPRIAYLRDLPDFLYSEFGIK